MDVAVIITYLIFYIAAKTFPQYLNYCLSIFTCMLVSLDNGGDLTASILALRLGLSNKSNAKSYNNLYTMVAYASAGDISIGILKKKYIHKKEQYLFKYLHWICYRTKKQILVNILKMIGRNFKVNFTKRRFLFRSKTA